MLGAPDLATLQSVLGVNEELGASTEATSARLNALVGAAAALDKAYVKIAGSADSAEAAFTRQNAAIGEQHCNAEVPSVGDTAVRITTSTSLAI